MRCTVPPDRVAVLDSAAAKRSGPYLTGTAITIGHDDLEDVECLLKEFVHWHVQLDRHSRDSLFLLSLIHI